MKKNIFFILVFIILLNNIICKIDNLNEIKIEVIENSKNYILFDYNATEDLKNLEINLKNNIYYFEKYININLDKIDCNINKSLFFFNKDKFLKFYSKINNFNFEIFKDIQEIRLKYKILFNMFEDLNFISPYKEIKISDDKEKVKRSFSSINNKLNELEDKYLYNKFKNYNLIHKINLIYIKGSHNNFSKIIYFFKNLFK